MLTKDIVREIKAVKGRDKFNETLNSLWTVSTPPSAFKSIVTQSIIAACPHLAPILTAAPITNGTANAVAAKLE